MDSNQNLVARALVRRRISRSGTIEAAARLAGCNKIEVWRDGERLVGTDAARVPARRWGWELVSLVKASIDMGNWDVTGTVFRIKVMDNVDRLLEAIQFA